MKKYQVFFLVLVFSLPGFLLAANPARKTSVGLRVEPEYFSPNADDFQDSTFFYPVLKSDKEVARWRLVIESEKGKLVQRLHGANFPALIKWDGKDRKDNPVAEGKYRGQLIIWGSNFKAASPWVAVSVDNSPPTATLSVSSTFYALTATGENKLIFSPRVEDKSPIQNWEFRITDPAERTVFVDWSTGPVRDLEWDGSNRDTGILSPKGLYHCTFQVWDAAGNRGLPAFVDVEINVSAQELLQRVLKYTAIFETDMGLVLQLPFDKIFLMKKGIPEFKPDAADYLREAAIVINAYPDVPVALTGYARQRKNWSEDRDLSSRIAWDVYSYLVKNGKVVSSRLKVNGRGRSPTFARRQYDNPPHFVVLRNGVEIILEGNRDWSQ